ncbi:MAG: hypothetical protein LQ340_001964 [Diploschistes diacapsis]|nr:MAG: hypothetical protein LQ340_001964 [Diploschistes diacapsis]
MAEDADREGIRTLAVLTKPDLVDKGAEDKVRPNDCFASEDELRLATVVKRLQEEFSNTMRKNGHIRGFQNSSSVKRATTTSESGYKQASKTMDGLPDVLETTDASDLEEIDHQSHLSSTALNPELQNELFLALATVPKLLEMPTDGIYDWIRREYDRSKGFEIGTINPSVLPVLYHEQIKNWRSITKSHINEVIKATHYFIYALLSHVCPDPAIRKKFWGYLLGPVLASYKNAIDHVDMLLQIEETGNMRTLNHYFAITRKRLQLARIQRRFAKSKTWETKDEKEPLIRMKDVLDIHLSNEDQAVEDLHDILRSYYKLSRKQFVDAISKGAVDFLLLTVKDGPLRVCSPEFVGALPDKDLEQIAGESTEDISVRANLARELSVLQEGQKILGA